MWIVKDSTWPWNKTLLILFYVQICRGTESLPRLRLNFDQVNGLECGGKHILWISQPINEQEPPPPPCTMSSIKKMTSFLAHAAHFKPFFFGSFDDTVLHFLKFLFRYVLMIFDRE